MPSVFVTRALPGDGLDRLRQVCAVEVWPDADPPPAAALLEAARGKDGLLTMLPDRVDVNLLDAAPSLRIVSNLAVGYDTIDVAAATQRGVLVTNTPGVLTETVADLTFALLLAFARRILEGDRMVRDGQWGAWSSLLLVGKEVHHSTLGIVGLGEIGLAVARRALGFNMRVIYNSRTRKPGLERDLGLEWRELPDLLRESDFVSLNVNLSPETRGLIGAEQLALMKPDAVLVNAARGPVVDQAALVDALRQHRIAGAALDVFAAEPIPAGDPLLALDNVVVAPHVGSATLRTRTLMADLAVNNLIAFFQGRRPPACVNPEVLS